MAARGDQEWIASLLLGQKNNAVPDDAAVASAYAQWRAAGEADLLLQIECENLFLVIDLWDAILRRVVVPNALEIVGIHKAFTRGDGKAHLGFFDGKSNLQQRMLEDPEWYRSHIYLPTPGPAYPGQPIEYPGAYSRKPIKDPPDPFQVRDDPIYDGGTYMVYRKYRLNLDAWFAESFTVTDAANRTYRDDEARVHAIGRSPISGKVVSRMSHKELESEPDHAEANLAFDESHVLKARGGRLAPFMGPFPPVALGHSHAFNTQDIRIRRRGMSYAEINNATGKVEYGLHFICFQNNIQQTGFEFINNIWLMNSDFRRSVDGLMNPVGKIVAPLEGAYFFVAPEQHSYPGDVFFE
jgi:deferrochelatase/peroxidase EfeB